MNAYPMPARSTGEEFEEDVPLDVLRLMTRAALTAVSYRMHAPAQMIVDGLTVNFGQYLAVAMACATVAAATDRQAEALATLEKLANANPEMDVIVCSCAMLKKELGVPGWRAMAQRVIKHDKDPLAVSMARDMLETPAPKSEPAHEERSPAPVVSAAAALRFT